MVVGDVPVKTLSDDQVNTLLAILFWFDEQTGLWPGLEKVMKEEFGIEDPEKAFVDLQEAVN